MVGMSLLGAAFLCWPLLGRSAARSADDRLAALRSAYQLRLDELARDDARDPAVRTELEAELGQLLLSEADRIGVPQAREHGAAKVWVYVSAAAVLLGSWLLFAFVSDYDVEKVAGAEAVLQLDASRDAEQLEHWIGQLEGRVAAQADDSKSLYLLGHARLKRGDFARAADAFARALQQVPDDLTIKIYLLQAQFLAGDGVLTEASRARAREVLDQQPNIPVVLEILASDAFRNGDPQAAVRFLNKAINGSRTAAQQASFAAAIQQIRTGFELPGLSVRVASEHAVPPHATLFVIARPVGGGMPYAVVRRPAALLPLTVRLDALVSMAEGRELPADEAFEVVVRLSLSGEPVKRPGDWEWQTELAGAAQADEVTAQLAPP